MAKTNMKATKVAPRTEGLLTLHVLRTERVTPNMQRITLGGGDADSFVPLGLDQWFRLFIPVDGGDLSRVPSKLDTFSYLKFLTVSKSSRPTLRNYSVRAYRPDGDGGPEIDVDFVVHGVDDGGHAGPAVTWAVGCEVGDAVGLLDEGTGFSLPPGTGHLRLVADETGLPAAANILATVPADLVGEAIIEIPTADDAQDLDHPEGVRIIWLPREGTDAGHGQLAYADAMTRPAPEGEWFGWVVGEQALATGVRRQWVDAGQPKDQLMFCGYWRAPKGTPTAG